MVKQLAGGSVQARLLMVSGRRAAVLRPALFDEPAASLAFRFQAMAIRYRHGRLSRRLVRPEATEGG